MKKEQKGGKGGEVRRKERKLLAQNESIYLNGRMNGRGKEKGKREKER